MLKSAASEFMEDMHSCPSLGQVSLMDYAQLGCAHDSHELLLQGLCPWHLSHMCYAQPMPHAYNEFNYLQAMAGAVEAPGLGCSSVTTADTTAERAPRTKAKCRKQRRQRLRRAIEETHAAALAAEAPAAPSAPAPGVLNGVRRRGLEAFCRARCEEAPLPERAKLVDDVVAEIASLATDPDGHAVVLRVFELADASQQQAYLRSLRFHFATLSNDQFGCRVLQVVLEQSTREQQEGLATCLRRRVVKSAEHPHANFVVQKCIEQIAPNALVFIGDEIKGRVCKLAQNEYGCRVIQRLLEFWSWSELYGIVDEILQRVHELSESKYGNFVVQHVLQHGRLVEQQIIIKTVAANVANYSKSKYSSRVVEKCFEILQMPENAVNLPEERRALTSTVLGIYRRKRTPVLELASHPYGNYVVQQAVKCCDDTVELRCLLSLFDADDSENGTSINQNVVAAIRHELARDARWFAAMVHRGG